MSLLPEYAGIHTLQVFDEKRTASFLRDNLRWDELTVVTLKQVLQAKGVHSKANEKDTILKLFREHIVSQLPLSWKCVTTLTVFTRFLPPSQFASIDIQGQLLRCVGVLLVSKAQSRRLIYFRGLHIFKVSGVPQTAVVLLEYINWPKIVGREAGAWIQMCAQPGVEEDGGGLFPSYGYSAVVANDTIWVFGGTTLYGQCVGGLFAFSISKRGWSCIQATGVMPGARAFHTAAAHPTQNRMFVFGGLTLPPGHSLAMSEPASTAYIYELDCETNIWSQIALDTSAGAALPPSCVERMAYWDGKVLLLTMCGEVFETEPKQGARWTRRVNSASFALPSFTSGIAATEYKGKSWYVYGNTGTSDEAFLYDFATGQWSAAMPTAAFKEDKALQGPSKFCLAADIASKIALLTPMQGAIKYIWQQAQEVLPGSEREEWRGTNLAWDVGILRAVRFQLAHLFSCLPQKRIIFKAADGSQVQCPSVVLSLYSPVFDSLFQETLEGAAEASVTMNTLDQDSGSMRRLLKWLYGLIHIGQMGLTETVDILRVADKYNIQPARSESRSRLTSAHTALNWPVVAKIQDLNLDLSTALTHRCSEWMNKQLLLPGWPPNMEEVLVALPALTNARYWPGCSTPSRGIEIALALLATVEPMPMNSGVLANWLTTCQYTTSTLIHVPAILTAISKLTQTDAAREDGRYELTVIAHACMIAVRLESLAGVERAFFALLKRSKPPAAVLVNLVTFSVDHDWPQLKEAVSEVMVLPECFPLLSELRQALQIVDVITHRSVMEWAAVNSTQALQAELHRSGALQQKVDKLEARNKQLSEQVVKAMASKRQRVENVLAPVTNRNQALR